MITAEQCQELFEYRAGILYWKPKYWSDGRPSKRNGKPVGTPGGVGYLDVSIDKRKFRVHRIIFLMFNGYLPKEVDHINNDRLDNRIENLRAADSVTNKYNSLMSRHNTSGIKGVSLHKPSGQWRCSMSIKNKTKQVFGFDSKEDAADFMELWRVTMHGEFANHGTAA